MATSTVSASLTRRPPTNSTGRSEALHVAGDLRAAAVDDDRVQPDVLEQHDVARELLAQRRVLHRRAAVLDDDRPAVELADVGQRLEQRGDVAHGVTWIRSSCRVLRVDASRSRAPRSEKNTSVSAPSPGRPTTYSTSGRSTSAPSRSASSRGRPAPAEADLHALDRDVERQRARVPASAPPMAWAMRPQFGSPPCSAVLTSGESATARATRLDAACVRRRARRPGRRAPAPSPSATISSASWRSSASSACAEAQLVLALRARPRRRSRPSTAAARCRWSTAGRRR